MPDAVPHSPVLRCAGTIAPSEESYKRGRIVGFDSGSENARSFDLIRTQIMRDDDGTEQRLIGITSATPAAGKTFVSLNLAAAMSRIANRAVVLCDFDLRRGSLLDVMGADVPTDLISYLKGEVQDWSDVLYRFEDSDLYVLPCKRIKRGSSEYVSSAAFAQLVASLRALPKDVMVLCDLPPVFASDDALLAMEQLDGYVMVVEYGRNTAVQVRESMRLLSSSPCIGTILNRYRGGFFDAYGYGYGDPYGIKHYGMDD